MIFYLFRNMWLDFYDVCLFSFFIVSLLRNRFCRFLRKKAFRPKRTERLFLCFIFLFFFILFSYQSGTPAAVFLLFSTGNTPPLRQILRLLQIFLFYASYTISPPRYVWHTGMSLMVLSSTSNGFWPSTTKSAIMPSAIWPFTFSSKLASALRIV